MGAMRISVLVVALAACGGSAPAIAPPVEIPISSTPEAAGPRPLPSPASSAVAHSAPPARSVERIPDPPSPTDPAAAEALFRDGRALMEAGNYAAACLKLAESQRLDPAEGTLLNLAMCEEKLGDRGEAIARYTQAYAMATASGRADRAAFIRARLAALGAPPP